ncbi:MAG: oxygen-independent coproporphyrinogen III oxidase [Pseudorhodoplanes sp.]|nr:oxygen-independent coproporphyrinogen III oxidase [Pseudorhodoplanes sp.]
MNIGHFNAERSVPRYTSYPTAPHFTPAIGPDRYVSWLADLPSHATLSLYLHVPYCTAICNYCGCHTKAVRRKEPLDRYAGRLLREIGMVGQATSARRVVHLHWGGGTPSILGEGQIGRIADRIAEIFDLSELREHAFELDPRHVTASLAKALAANGVDRASLGAQDFSPRVQQAIGRIQPFDSVAAAVATLRDAGIERINLDLMYGLPFQSVEDIRRNAALAASLHPQRVAIFGYAHVPWLKANQRLIDQGALPGASERIAQAQAAADTLVQHGYVPIGLDHFAKPNDDLAVAMRAGRLQRNFQGYTTDTADALIGLGASAIGRLPQGFAQNAPDMAAYSRMLDAGGFATAKGLALSPDDRMRGQIIERLMCDMSVDLGAIDLPDSMHAVDFSSELDSLVPLARDGIVQIAGRRVTMTEQGRPFVRLVAAAFDGYLASSRARHSIAV